jgi:hypothetical protein
VSPAPLRLAPRVVLCPLVLSVRPLGPQLALTSYSRSSRRVAGPVLA